MGIWDRLQKTEQGLRKRVESALGQEKVPAPDEVRVEILEQVMSRTKTDAGGKGFSFDKITVLLQPHTKNQHDAFNEAFLKNGSLKADILQALRKAGVSPTDNQEICVEFRQEPSRDLKEGAAIPSFHLSFHSSDSSHGQDIPEAILTVLKGSAERPVYRVKQTRILIGCLPEVLDREGRMVRKNDVVFPENGDDINSTVGGIHARIWYESGHREFRIMDEASRYGTRIIRRGHSIELPGGSDRGIRLHSGDEIYCGLACIRFEQMPPSDGGQKTSV
jgi:hypothetical protein